PRDRRLLKAQELHETIKGVVVLIRKVQDPVKDASRASARKKTLQNLPYDGSKRPRHGVDIYWKWVWTRAECEQNNRPQCVPPSRYRPVTPEDKKHPSWRAAVQTARYLLSGEPPYGAFIPLMAGGVRYVAYISPHTATDIDIDGDGRLERVPLDEPVRGVSLYIRKVQPGR
ncbi:MAG: hypothetical protein AAFS10_01815, partial [Myxococcota bacterium]